MKLRWSELWARLWLGKKSQGPVGPPDRAWFSWGWGASTPQVVALAVAVVLFGGLAVWIVIRVVSFFSAYGALTDKFAK
jgi:hypothetical protein